MCIRDRLKPGGERNADENFSSLARAAFEIKVKISAVIQLEAGINVLDSVAVAFVGDLQIPVSYTHLRAHETRHDLVCRLLLEKKKSLQNLSLIHI